MQLFILGLTDYRFYSARLHARRCRSGLRGDEMWMMKIKPDQATVNERMNKFVSCQVK